MRKLRTKSLAGTALAAALATPVAAQTDTAGRDADAETARAGDAQDAPGEEAQGAAQPVEIIVTAQKRSQTLFDIPQAVSVVSGDVLERQNATNFTDYLNNVPSLQLVQATPGQGRLVLRGVNTGGVASTVAVYVDETPFGSSSALANGAVLAGDFDTFDIARIEVLRGPQGTLYGASSLGGLIKFVTNKPSTAGVEAKALTGIEFTDGGDPSYRGAGMINLPLGDTLAFRASGSYRKQGGFIDSIGTGGSRIEDNINDYQSYGGRASLRWTPDSPLTVRLSALFQDIKVDAPTIVEAGPATLEPLYGGLTLSAYVPAFSDVKYRLYNATLEYDLGFASLTSSTSYGQQLQSRRDDVTGNLSEPLAGEMSDLLELLGAPRIPQNNAHFRQLTENRKWTQELRLTSNGGDFLDWLVGGYYTHEKARIFQHLNLVEPGTLTPIAYPLELAKYELDSRYEEFAGFANATLHLAPWFDIDLGGRYSYNRQSADQTVDGLFLAGSPSVSGVESSDKVFTYSVAPKIKFGDRASLYARVAKGYRPGGPNVIPPNAPPGTPATFEPDTVTSYEIGFKGETADRTFAIEAAVYHIDWNDVQLYANINNFGVNVNGEGAEVDGAEIAATLRPTDGLVTSINVAINDAKLTGDTDPLVVGAVAGDPLPFTPKYSVSVNADYQWAIGDDATASVGGSLRSLSRQTGSYDPVYLALYGHFPRVPAYEVIDLRAGLTFGRYSINAYVKNLINVAGITATQPYTANGYFQHPNGAIGTGVIRPRTAGVSLTVGF